MVDRPQPKGARPLRQRHQLRARLVHHAAHSSEAFKVKGREFIIDSDYTMAVAWKLYFGDLMTDLVFGPLRWTPDS